MLHYKLHRRVELPQMNSMDSDCKQMVYEYRHAKEWHPNCYIRATPQSTRLFNLLVDEVPDDGYEAPVEEPDESR